MYGRPLRQYRYTTLQSTGDRDETEEAAFTAFLARKYWVQAGIVGAVYQEEGIWSLSEIVVDVYRLGDERARSGNLRKAQSGAISPPKRATILLSQCLQAPRHTIHNVLAPLLHHSTVLYTIPMSRIHHQRAALPVKPHTMLQ